ncbi:transposase family protein [Streptomyces sp. B4I13]|uniref:transposase family protein n=1 Tax=Streptomyces sp. B4I13 TaxID=3042271 RepID=UPI0035940530
MCVPVVESMSLASERTLLLRRLAEVRDPRDPRGRCFSLVSLLLVTLCATAAGFGSYRAMAQWAAAAGPVELLRLGLRPCGPFRLVRTPSADTLRRSALRTCPRNSWKCRRGCGSTVPTWRTAPRSGASPGTPAPST